MENNTLRRSAALRILGLLALLCTLVGCVGYFFTYTYHAATDTYTLTWITPPVPSWIALLLRVAPSVLFVLYVFSFHKKAGSSLFVLGVFALTAILPIYDFLRTTVAMNTLIVFCLQALPILFCIIAALTTLKKFMKLPAILAMAFFLGYQALVLLSFLLTMSYRIRTGQQLYLYILPMQAIGAVFLCTGMLLLCVSNKLPPVLAPKAKQEPADPEI